MTTLRGRDERDTHMTHRCHKPPDPGDLPYPLTFFLTARDRAKVLRALKRIDTNRSRALLTALKLRKQR